MKQELVRNTYPYKHIIHTKVNSQIYSHPKHCSCVKKINTVSTKLHSDLYNRGGKHVVYHSLRSICLLYICILYTYFFFCMYLFVYTS